MPDSARVDHSKFRSVWKRRHLDSQSRGSTLVPRVKMFKQVKRPPPDFRILKLRAAEDANKDMTDYIKVRLCQSPVEERAKLRRRHAVGLATRPVPPASHGFGSSAQGAGRVSYVCGPLHIPGVGVPLRAGVTLPLPPRHSSSAAFVLTKLILPPPTLLFSRRAPSAMGTRSGRWTRTGRSPRTRW